MSDQRTGRELTPREDDGRIEPVVSGDQLDVERFSAGPRAHSVGLTEERAAQVVRQSGNARSVAFLAVLLIALFIPVYWFYDLGVTATGTQGRMAATKETQYVTDVARGYDLFLNNCSTCHGQNGEGGVGPPLNNQDKLYNAVTADGRSGTGHLNPQYIKKVLEVGGRYVCGDPKSLMPAWLAPNGPLNYRQVEELISFLTASTETQFEWPLEGAHTTTVVEHREVTGWRDPEYVPDPAQPTPPACWRNPSGQIGGTAPTTATTGAASIDNPGTADAPRVIQLHETADLQITDPDGTKVTSIPVKAGETVRFEVDNTAGFTHNFFIGTDANLAGNNRAELVGIPDWTEGVQTYDWTVPSEGELKYGCTVPGHYALMQGTFAIQP
jgi:mono/diheme cytochrome c family protein/uncharacterized cupredoxin-like copper-binding protein